MVDRIAEARAARRCLLIGARGFLGRRVEQRLRQQGVVTTGTTRKLRPGDPAEWIAFRFTDGTPKAPGFGAGFDFIIVAARLFEPTGAPSAELETRLAEFFTMLQGAGRDGRVPLVVYVSSDAVFSGDRGGYVESDAADASGDYGACHRLAESALKAAASRHLIVRTSFIFDPQDIAGDKRIARLAAALADGRTIEADVNVYKSPVRVDDVAGRIVEAALRGDVGIRHVDAPRKSVHQFFIDCIREAGLPSDHGLLVRRHAERPADTSLMSSHTLGAP